MRRKRDSKRRWVAKFQCGRVIPWLVVVEYDIEHRLKPAKYLVNLDAIQRA